MTHPYAEPRQVLSLWHGTINAPPAPRTGREIIEDIAAQYGLTRDDLRSKTRARRIAWPRQHAMYELYITGQFSSLQIAIMLGLEDHSTVIHGRRRHEERMSANAPATAAAPCAGRAWLKEQLATGALTPSAHSKTPQDRGDLRR